MQWYLEIDATLLTLIIWWVFLRWLFSKFLLLFFKGRLIQISSVFKCGNITFFLLSRSVRFNEDKGEVPEVLNLNNIRDSWKLNLKLFKFLCKSLTSYLWDGKGIGRRHSHIILRCLSSDIYLYFKVEFYLIFSLYHCCPSLLTI